MARPGEQCARQRAFHPLDTAIERQFTKDQVLRQAIAFFKNPVIRGRQYSERHRQVESRTFFARIGGRQIDCHPAARKRITTIADSRLDPVKRLAYGALRQPHHPKAGGTAAAIDLHFDRKCVDSGKRAGQYTREQSATSVAWPRH
jgi:hypothetical protein